MLEEHHVKFHMNERVTEIRGDGGKVRSPEADGADGQMQVLDSCVFAGEGGGAEERCHPGG